MEYVEDLEEDDSDIEDTAEWGGSYWGAPGPKAGAGAKGDNDSEEDDAEDDDAEDDDGEGINRRVVVSRCVFFFVFEFIIFVSCCQTDTVLQTPVVL